MNFLSIFVLIPLLMLAGLWAARGIKAIRGVMVTGASALLIASVVLTFMYLGEHSERIFPLVHSMGVFGFFISIVLFTMGRKDSDTQP